MVKSKFNLDLNVVNTVLLVVILCLVVYPCLKSVENYKEKKKPLVGAYSNGGKPYKGKPGKAMGSDRQTMLGYKKAMQNVGSTNKDNSYFGANPSELTTGDNFSGRKTGYYGKAQKLVTGKN